MKKSLLIAGPLFVAVSMSAFALQTLSPSPSSMPDTTSELTTKPAAANLTKSEIRDAQKALNDEVDAGLKLDGHLGAKTQNALRKYQDDHGLAVTGTFTNETLDELGVDVADRAPASIDQAVPATPEEATPVK